MLIHRPYREFRKLSTDQLIAEFDLLVEPPRHAFGPEQILSEMARRDAASQTCQIKWLTVAIFVLTVVNVVLVGWTILR